MGLISRVSSRTYSLFKDRFNMYEALKEHLDNQKQYDYDPRFRGQNKQRECCWNYVDHYRCLRVLGDRGDDTRPCDWFKKQYLNVCFVQYHKAWDEMREE